ncbi:MULTISPECIES: hypothetical protein [Methylococcus]|jgi:hypothetical protein|uniref:Uncharacterized protein n=1 Tax=Methylococcus capsulatus TaxID=414 RepID=A0AA35UC27_METCP|nr:hypothetical protein [Methylococcus capsulatus]CAI8732331.1 conserved membrane protein of unknown function [Methylococcus capsulatus]
MPQSSPPENKLLLQGAALWLLLALILAWCLVGLNFGLPLLPSLFAGKFTRLVQAHLDLLLMSALLFGFHAAKILLPRPVSWAMVLGAFTNSSLFLLQAIVPALDAPPAPGNSAQAAFGLYAVASVTLTSYGFGRAAVIVLCSTFKAG